MTLPTATLTVSSETQGFSPDARLLARALAGQFPYAPEHIEFRKHPSLTRHLQPEGRYFVLPAWDERSITVAVEVCRRTAMLNLKGKDVRHAEVVMMTVKNAVSMPHEACDEEGCDECNGLGHLFQEREGEAVHLMGWLAMVMRHDH